MCSLWAEVQSEAISKLNRSCQLLNTLGHASSCIHANSELRKPITVPEVSCVCSCFSKTMSLSLTMSQHQNVPCSSITSPAAASGSGFKPAFFFSIVSRDLGLRRASLAATFSPAVAFCLEFLLIQRPIKPASGWPPPPTMSLRISRVWFFSNLPLLSCRRHVVMLHPHCTYPSIFRLHSC